MITKTKKQSTGLKQLLVVPIIFVLLQACSFHSYKFENEKINGTYRIVYEEWVSDGASTVNKYNPNTSGLKTWSDKYFLWVNSSPRGMEPASSFGGGTYILDGNRYIENTEHQTSAAYRGGSMKLYLEMKKDTVIQIWPVDNNFNYDKNNCQIQKYVRVD